MIYLDFEQDENGNLKNSGDGTVTIDNKHKAFIDTEFEDWGFKIKGIPPETRQLDGYRKDCMSKKGRLNSMAYNEKIWMNHVVGWEMNDKNKKDIPFNEANKKFFRQKLPGFTTAIAQLLVDGYVQDKEDVEKNSSTSGNGD